METPKELQPHQQRVIDERKELDDKIKKLGPFILDNPIFLTLETEEQIDLKSQYEFMNKYLSVLDRRIGRF
jgi:hypothetical protein